ncbi:Terminase-like protein [Candidatus Magnetoovum chiemensis]|nr:Terminase-like protein [Candidatus Magnetoovum chiemensis]
MAVIELYEYQKKWLLDSARFKEGRWARQTGKSYSCAAGIVLDSRQQDRNKWVALSSGQRQVDEFMEKIEFHASVTGEAIKWAEDKYGYESAQGFREEYRVKKCTLKNGSKIIGIPANPDTARGYSANVYLDEFSVHKNSRELWASVFPIISRGGYKLWITYTPKGKQNKAYEISSNAMFSHHVIDIYEAVRQGCPHDIGLLKAAISDADVWAQEYEAQFLDEATAFITYDLINAAENDNAGAPFRYQGGSVYVGMDIGRRKDLTVIAAAEAVGDVLWVRELVTMQRQTFSAQEQEVGRIIRQYKPLRVCVDQTGMGEKFVEDLQLKYGNIVEGALFTAAVKLDLANALKRKFEDRLIRIPAGQEIRDDIHSVKKITTSAGNIRFDAERSEHSHADRFWALALAVHGSDSATGPIEYESVRGRGLNFAKGAW